MSNANSPSSEGPTESEREESLRGEGERSSGATATADEHRSTVTTNICDKCRLGEADAVMALNDSEQSPSGKPNLSRWGLKQWWSFWSEQEPLMVELKNDLQTCEAHRKEAERSHTAFRNAGIRERTRLSRELTEANGCIFTLNQQISSLKQKSREDREKWNHDFSSLKQQLTQITREKKVLIDELLEERSFTMELQAEKKANQAIIAKAQTAAVKALSQSVSSELPDDVIQNRFSEVLEEAQDWARENATPAFQQESSLETRSALWNFLHEQNLLASGADMKRHEQFDISVSSAADTLLETAISHELCHAFLQSPYFLCRWLVSEAGAEPVVEAPGVLKRLEGHMMTTHYDEALAWRAKTLQLTSGKDEQSIAARNKAYQTFTSDFLKRWADLIRDDIDQAELQEERNIILDVVTRFGDLTLELWGLKREIKFHGLDYFADKPFRVRSPEMVAAKITQLQEGSTRLDGRRIPLVIQPMIASYVRMEGKNMRRRIIWSKGVVWVSNRKEAAVQAQPDEPAPSDRMDVTDASSAMDET